MRSLYQHPRLPRVNFVQYVLLEANPVYFCKIMRYL